MKMKPSILLFIMSAVITTAAHANLTCEYFGNNRYICDVYDGIDSENTYFWTASGGLQLSSSGSFIALVTCSPYSYGGTVTVITTHPDGSTETMSDSISCGGGGF